MDWKSFIASIISSLAWPSVAVVLLIIIRKPLKDLLPNLQKLKYKELEMDFEQEVEEVRAEIAKALPAASMRALPDPAIEKLIRLAEVSPRAAILEAWLNVELATLEVTRRLRGESFHHKTLTFQALRFLEHNESVDRDIISLLRDLRGLRNQAAHAPDFMLSKSEALEYAASADAIILYLKSLAKGE